VAAFAGTVTAAGIARSLVLEPRAIDVSEPAAAASITLQVALPPGFSNEGVQETALTVGGPVTPAEPAVAVIGSSEPSAATPTA